MVDRKVVFSILRACVADSYPEWTLVRQTCHPVVESGRWADVEVAVKEGGKRIGVIKASVQDGTHVDSWSFVADP